MREKTALEKLIRETWIRTEKGAIVVKPEDAEVIFAIQNTLMYLKALDEQKDTRHRKCFVKGYLNTSRRVFQFEVALEFLFTQDTVSDNFKMYIKIFESNLAFAKAVKPVICDSGFKVLPMFRRITERLTNLREG